LKEIFDKINGGIQVAIRGWHKFGRKFVRDFVSVEFAINETHSNMKLCNGELATVVHVGQGPNSGKIVLIQAALPEDFNRRLSINEASVGGIPRLKI